MRASAGSHERTRRALGKCGSDDAVATVHNNGRLTFRWQRSLGRINHALQTDKSRRRRRATAAREVDGNGSVSRGGNPRQNFVPTPGAVPTAVQKEKVRHARPPCCARRNVTQGGPTRTPNPDVESGRRRWPRGTSYLGLAPLVQKGAFGSHHRVLASIAQTVRSRLRSQTYAEHGLFLSGVMAVALRCYF